MARRRGVGLLVRAQAAFARQDAIGVTNVQIAEFCDITPQTVAGWRSWSRGGTGSAIPGAQLDRVERYLDQVETEQADAGRGSVQGITFRDAHTVVDQAARLKMSPEAVYEALIRVVAAFNRFVDTTGGGDGPGPSPSTTADEDKGSTTEGP